MQGSFGASLNDHSAEQPRAADAPVAAVVSAPRSRVFLVATVAALALGADLATKVAIVANIGPDHRPVRLLGGAIYLVQARNSGAAFSVGTGATVALTALSIAVVIVIIRSARRLASNWWALSLGLILGGAFGNLVDRFFRAPSPGRGHVVDWISLFCDDGHIWPIFNLADSSIVVGAAIAFVLSVLGVAFTSGRTHNSSGGLRRG